MLIAASIESAIAEYHCYLGCKSSVGSNMVPPEVRRPEPSTAAPWTWIQVKASWPLLATSAVAALGAVILGGWMWREATHSRVKAESDSVRIHGRHASEPADARSIQTDSVSSGDFTRRLPDVTRVDTLTIELQRVCKSAGVRIVAMEFVRGEASAVELGRSEVSFTLRGRYLKIKDAMDAALSRFPNATLRRLTLRQVPPSTESEALIVIALWAKPRAMAPNSSIWTP